MSKARDIADLDFNSPDIDGGNIDGAVIGGTTPAAGSFSQVNVDRIEAPSNFTIDAGGEIYLDAATAGVVRLLKNTSNYGAFFLDANNFTIKSEIADQDFLIAGNDGGSTVHALKLDMSLGGTAIFNNNVGIGQTPTAFSNWRVLELKALSAGAMLNYENSSSARVAALAYDEGSTQLRIQTMVDAPIKFEPNNAVALTLDGNQKATFASNVLGTIINAGAFSSEGIGGSMADANVAEMGPGYLNLARDDTADAKQLSFYKNGAIHSFIETTSSLLTITNRINNADILFTANKNGADTQILRLDGSEGDAIFGGNIEFSAIATHASMGNVSISIPDRQASLYNTGDRGNITIQASSSTSGVQALSGGRVLINAGNSNNGQTGDVIISTGTNILNNNDNGKIRFNIGGRTSTEEVARFNQHGDHILQKQERNYLHTVREFSGGDASSYSSTYSANMPEGNGFVIPDSGFITLGEISTRAYANYICVKTNYTGDGLLFLFRGYGYHYNYGISEWWSGGYTYQGGVIVKSSYETGSASASVSDTYRATDGSLCLKLYLGQSGYTEGKTVIQLHSHGQGSWLNTKITAVQIRNDGTNHPF